MQGQEKVEYYLVDLNIDLNIKHVFNSRPTQTDPETGRDSGN